MVLKLFKNLFFKDLSNAMNYAFKTELNDPNYFFDSNNKLDIDKFTKYMVDNCYRSTF